MTNIIPTFSDSNIPRELKKYYDRRYNLWSRYDQGIKLNYQGWFSVTPEDIAKSIASSISVNDIDKDYILVAHLGTGSIAIQTTLMGYKVIGLDINKEMIDLSIHNSMIYDIPIIPNCKEFNDRNKIVFVNDDIWKYHPDPKIKTMICDPEWGGLNYKQTFDIEQLEIIDFVKYCILFNIEYLIISVPSFIPVDKIPLNQYCNIMHKKYINICKYDIEEYKKYKKYKDYKDYKDYIIN